MFDFLLAFLAALRVFVHSRADLSLEMLALRQQVSVLKRKRPPPRWNGFDRCFWISLQQLWPRGADVLAIVKPETVVGWHRTGFRWYWRWRSRPRSGWSRIQKELRALIRRMAAENRDGGRRRFTAELRQLGFDVSERTVARSLQGVRHRGDPSKRWPF